MRAAVIQTPEFVRVSKAQEYFGISEMTARRWAKAGRIALHKVGRCTFLDVAEVRRAIAGKAA